MKKKYGSIALKMLEEILRISEGLPLIFLDRKEFHRRLSSDDFSYSKFMDRIRRLEKENFIKIGDSANGLSIEITNKGRIKCIENSKNNEVDGKWRMLSFDIPEKYRNKRNVFRRSIKKIGYKQVQKSLWVCPYIRGEEVELIEEELGINEYVAYLVVEKTDIDEYLKELFKNTTTRGRSS